ncbi:MAG: YigZ family protein [Lachnospiraceae bacterium]|nr:YigZ family protein [Lachnospiraceae bacterium]
MGDYRTIRTSGQGEIVEKKSRFIGEVHFAKDLQEAESYLAAARKKYYDARHHCFACITGTPDTPEEILRSNDDGEPGGTAGKPMLEVLTGEGLHYAAAVVTRYFGGTLLGTGGLVRAYTAAIRAAVENAEIITVIHGRKLSYQVTYSQAGKLQYVYAGEQLPQPEIEYGQEVVMHLLVPDHKIDRIKKLTIDATNGQARLIGESLCEYTI